MLRCSAAAACALRLRMGVVYQAPHREFSCSVIAPSAPCSARQSSLCPGRTPAQPRTAVERQRGARRGAALAARPRGDADPSLPSQVVVVSLGGRWWLAWPGGDHFRSASEMVCHVLLAFSTVKCERVVRWFQLALLFLLRSLSLFASFFS